MKKTKASWVEPLLHLSEAPRPVPMGRRRLLEVMATNRYLKGEPSEHAALLHRKFYDMGKQLDARVEVGLSVAEFWPSWPYAAIALFDGEQMTQGFLVIPCASDCGPPREVFVDGDEESIGVPLWYGWTGLCPVKQEIEGPKGQVIEITSDRLADEDTVERCDAYLLNLTACPRLRYQGQGLGTAVTFGQIDEVIDTVRCRLAFGMLPSA
jgi:hypothetical protein